MSAETAQDCTARPVLIGVLLNNKNIIYGAHPGSTRLVLLNKANQAVRSTLYLFSLKDIYYENNMIYGAYFDHDQGRWLNQYFTFPDVLYLRDGVPEHRKKELQRFLSATKAINTRKVNNLPAFNKWDVHQVLCSDRRIKLYLPETRLYRRYGGDLVPMLQHYGRVYLKACRGRQGRQVMQITRLPNGYYEFSYFVRNLTSRRVPLNSLYQVIHDFFGGKDFIIQEPIDLIEIDGMKVDLRSEVQRNGRGDLEIVAVPVRVGRKNSPITTHALSYRFEDFFFDQMHYSEAALESLEKRIHHFLFSVYESIEKYYGPFGEMGIDLGLDKNGKLWFIECNSQPAKVSLINAYNEITVTKAFTNPLEYALYIAGSANG
ncbi:MAG: YheC/YheD family protein [Bacillota bacterium]